VYRFDLGMVGNIERNQRSGSDWPTPNRFISFDYLALNETPSLSQGGERIGEPDPAGLHGLVIQGRACVGLRGRAPGRESVLVLCPSAVEPGVTIFGSQPPVRIQLALDADAPGRTVGPEGRVGLVEGIIGDVARLEPAERPAAKPV
jgi:hypothetical protein